ncbi:Lar family restriction alleviation protein [Burkholderia cepacia]|uniref:Lar family restriction alleviation protein n=1 Tax=Burkholderia cepacia TaxID=292 RepID=UPI00158C8A0B|nr:Lar family restriction alleviation protein [Burkholderia cepacia]
MTTTSNEKSRADALTYRMTEFDVLLDGYQESLQDGPLKERVDARNELRLAYRTALLAASPVEQPAAAPIDGLLPCPFCGGEPKRMMLSDEVNFGGDVIVCTKCDCSTHVEFGEKLGLVEAWNSRVAHSRSPAMAAEAVAGVFVKHSKFGPWIEIEKPEPGAVTLYTAPRPAQADARVGLTVEQREALEIAFSLIGLSGDPRVRKMHQVLHGLLQGANHAE